MASRFKLIFFYSYKIFVVLYTYVLRIIWHITQPRCVSCKELVDLYQRLCHGCRLRIAPVVSKSLAITERYEISVWAAGAYEGPLRDLVLAKKQRDVYASRIMGEIMWQQSGIKEIPFDCIVPIPLHWTRYAERGYNQAEEMAYVIARHAGKPIMNIIKRNKKTQFQALLSMAQKQENVKNAFCLRTGEKTLEGKTILIIDDVLTSGSTIKAVVQELRRLKPARIIAVVGARAI